MVSNKIILPKKMLKLSLDLRGLELHNKYKSQKTSQQPSTVPIVQVSLYNLITSYLRNS